jgi:hypothetical protein
MARGVPVESLDELCNALVLEWCACIEAWLSAVNIHG